MALVVLSVVELRLDAVRAVLAGAEVTEVASQAGVHRPTSCPHQAVEPVEVAVAEMRWGIRAADTYMPYIPLATRIDVAAR